MIQSPVVPSTLDCTFAIWMSCLGHRIAPLGISKFPTVCLVVAGHAHAKPWIKLIFDWFIAISGSLTIPGIFSEKILVFSLICIPKKQCFLVWARNFSNDCRINCIHQPDMRSVSVPKHRYMIDFWVLIK